MSVSLLSSRRISRASVLLVRMCAVQEWGVDFDRCDVFPRDEGQLGNAQDGGTGDGEPGSTGATGTVDDADKRRRDSPCEAASRHGKSVDSAEDLGRRCCLFEENEGSRVDDDADEALRDEGDVDQGRCQVCRSSADERQHEVGDREQDHHPDERLPDSDLFDKDGEDDSLNE